MRLLAPALLVGALLPATAAGAGAAPNVLVVMTDDQAAHGTMAVMPKTRRLIGRRGARFAQAHATTPSCCPSRASFFTGRYAHNHGVTDNFAAARLDHDRTVQRLLRRRGYRTAIFGKFLNRWPLDVDPPHFDDWAVTEGGFYGTVWNDQGRMREPDRYSTDFIAKRSLRFIRRAEAEDARPWLAWVMPSAPHLPGTPARRHRNAPLPAFPLTPALTEDDFSDKPELTNAARGFDEQIVAVRDDGRRALMAVDEMVARLVRELRRRRELSRTLIVYTSDNGLLLGQHGGLAGKDLPYEASTRIPLMVRWDGTVAPRRMRRDLVSNVDVATTILRAAGVRRRTDGKSLLAKRRRERLFLESFGARRDADTLALPPWRALRTRRFVYAEYRSPDGELLDREYYDLRHDRWGLENGVDGLGAARVSGLSRTLARLSRCKNRSCP